MSEHCQVPVEAARETVADLPSSGVLDHQAITSHEQGNVESTVVHESVLTLSPGPPPPPNEQPQYEVDRPDFSRLKVGELSNSIVDADEVRAQVTRWLLNELAPLLGIDPKRIEIRVNNEAEVRANARGARGVMETGTIYLHPKLYRPKSEEGRYLLAHEAAHLAQLSAPPSIPVSADRAVIQAEREADEVAHAFVKGLPVRLPRQRVPSGRAMALETVADSSGPTLSALVAQNRTAEIAVIEDRLSYGVFDWKITDGDLIDILRELESLDFLTVTSLAELLTPKNRARFVDNLGSVHFAAFRSTLIAFYLGMIHQGEVDVLPENPFPGMAWTGLSASEHYGMREILTAYLATDRGRAWQTRNSNKDKVIQDIISTEPQFNVDKELEKARKQEEKVATERREATEALESQDVGDFLTQATKKLTYHLADWAITDREALAVLDGMADFASEPAKLRGIVSELERAGLMDRLIDNIPVEKLYTDVGKKTGGGQINRRRIFLQMAALRPPAKNVALAQALLSKGLFDWAITDEDAYLSQQLLKALPPRSRESFLAVEGGKFGTLLDEELSLSMKKGETANYYQGGEDGQDLQKLKAQLLDDALWSTDENQIRRLRMLIEMAIAAGEHDWVFAQTKDRYQLYIPFRELYADQNFFERIIEGFGLYKPAGLKLPDGTIDKEGREQYQGEKIEGKAFGSDNLVATIIEAFGFLIHSERIQIFRESIGGEGIDFKEFQDIFGGSFLGAEFMGPKDVPADQAAALKDNSIRWDLDHGIFELRASRLDLKAINYPMANMKVQTGSTVIENIHLHLEYPATDSEQQTMALVLRADSVVLNDLMLIFNDSMIGIEQLAMDGLVVDLRPDSATFELSSPSDNMAWGAVFSLGLSNLTKITGDLLFFIPTPATSRLGELTKGLLEPPNPLNIAVTSQAVRIKGITTSGGQYVDQLNITDFVMRSRGAESLENYIQGLKDEKQRLEKRQTMLTATPPSSTPKPRHYVELETSSSLDLQLKSIDLELKHIEEAKAEQQQLTDKKQNGALSPADEHKLWRASKYLEGLAKGGMALDMASVQLSGLAGSVSAREVGIGETHGYGQTAGAALGFLFSSTTMNRMLRGKDYRGTLAGIDEEGEPQVFIETNQLTLKELALEGQVPTLSEAEKALKKAQDRLAATPNDASLIVKRDRALVLREAAATYWGLLEKPGGLLLGDEREKLTKARQELLKDRAFFAQLLTLDDATLELGQGASGERIGVTAQSIHGEGLKAGGVVVGALDGKNVMVGAESTGGLGALLKDWRKELRTGQFAADSLIATNIVEAGSGATVDRVALTSAGATLDVNGEGKLDVRATKIEVTGVSVLATRHLLEAEREFLLLVPAEARHEADDKKITAIDESLKELDAFEGVERECQVALDEARKSGQPKDIAKAEEMLEFAKFAKVEWQRRLIVRGLSVDQLNISVLGLGNVLDEDFDPKAAVARGIQISGGGAGGRWFDAARLKDSKIPGLSGDDVVIGPTGGKVKHSEQQTVLDDFFIDSIEATGMEFHAPPHHLSSLGTSRLTGLHGSATFTREKRPDKKGFPTWQLASVEIPSLKIDKIEGSNLNYAFSTLEGYYDLEIESGSVGNVWVDNLLVNFPEGDEMVLQGIDPEKPGGAGIDQVNNLKMVGFLGEKIKAGGLLNGHGLKAEFIDAKKQRFTIDQITATQGTYSKQGVADLGFTVRKLGLAVTREITDTGDIFDIEKITVPSVTLNTGCTFTKGSMTVELLGTADLVGIALSAKVTRTKQGDKYDVASAVIKDIVIPDITATKIHVMVAGKAADPAKGTKESSPIDVMVPNASIKNFHAWGFDVLNLSKGSFETTSANLTDITVEIAKRGEAEFKKIGLTVTSEGLAGTLMEHNRLFLDLGKTDLTGSYEGGGLDIKKVSLTGIGGFVDIGEDYIRVFDLNTGPLKIGPVVHKDDTGNRLDMASIDCPAVHLRDLNAKWIKDPTTKESKFAELTFSGLKFDSIAATGFKYRGRFTSENEKHEKEVSRLELDATSATLEPLIIENFTYDALTEMINIEPSFSNLSISEFQANWRKWVDGKQMNKLKLMTDITGKEMKANLNFGNVTSATGAAWKFSNGTFHIDEFGLKHPDVDYSYRDDKGDMQKWALKNLPGMTDSAIDLKGLDVTVMPDGTMYVDFDALAAKHIQLKQDGGPTIDINLAELKNAAAALQLPTPEKTFEVLGAKLDELKVQGVKVTMEVDRNAPASGPAGPTDPWSLDALNSLNGGLRLYFTDAKSYVDADVNVPISNGVIDFNQVDLEHLGPNSAMGISEEGIYVDGVSSIILRSYIYERRDIKDATFEVINIHEPVGPDDNFSYDIPDRGSLNLRGFLEQMLNDPLVGTGEAPKQLTELNRMNLGGQLTIGDDSLGTSKNGVTLSGSKTGKNTISITGANMGQNLRIEIPQFEASKGKFEALGKAGETGQISAKIKLDIAGLGNAANAAGHFVFTVTLQVENGTVKDIKWGDVAILSATEKRATEQNDAAKKAKEEKAAAAAAAATAK